MYLVRSTKGEEVDQGETDAKNVPQVFGNSGKIPPQISNIAHYVRRSGGKPRMLLLPLGELAVYKAFFSDRVFEVGMCQFCSCDSPEPLAQLSLADVS